ncbi:MAG: IPT/TIG domain-containing protein [Bacteroidetes bacterium]|nr:IPT/TIG domain-containing protein [Bacteroidota bacterium]MBU1117293.1 IPT/TIG domain-containing protein [Bacteroidota bacterium]MBU1797367.1 IPT/TIG domain-containing protein [Bacteroidota bacterium]
MSEKIKKLFLLSIYCGLGLIILTQCTNDYPDSFYNANVVARATPTISHIEPDIALAGVDIITIIGNNFSEKPDENTVYFNSEKATVISSSINNIVVKAPNLPLDSIKVKIDVAGALNYSNIELYKLYPAVEEVFPFETYQEPYTVTSDGMGNLYFSFIEDAAGKGIYKTSVDGVLSEFAPRGGETTFSDLKYNSEGYLIGVYGNKAIFKIEAGVKPAVFVNTNNNSIKLFALDYDKDKNIWAAGKGGKIVCAKLDLSFKLFDYADDISGLRVFNDYLYAISGKDNAQSIVRFPIVSADSLGNVEAIFNFSGNVDADVVANSITFSAEGQMYIATTASPKNEAPVDPIMVVKSDGSFSTLYAGVISSSSSRLSWGSGTEMFIIKERFPIDRALSAIFSQNILKLNMVKAGAPEFGRD